MSTHSRMSVAVVVAALTLAGCGGGDPQAGQTPSPSASSASPASTPSPSPTGPPEQPRGKYGVTFQILNWEEVADDEAVLAWKQAMEAIGGSVNKQALIPGTLSWYGPKKVKRAFLGSVEIARDNNLHVPKVAKVRVQQATTTASRSRLVNCLWAPSSKMRYPNNNIYGGQDRTWSRQLIWMKKVGGSWKITKFSYPGTCKGKAPR